MQTQLSQLEHILGLGEPASTGKPAQEISQDVLDSLGELSSWRVGLDMDRQEDEHKDLDVIDEEEAEAEVLVVKSDVDVDDDGADRENYQDEKDVSGKSGVGLR